MKNQFPRSQVKMIVLTTFALVACGKAKTSVPGPAQPPPYTLIGPTTPENLAGNWVSACERPSSGLFGMDYARRQFSIKDNVLTVVVASYASKDCKPEELDRALILSGSFELAGAAPRGGSNLNYSIQSVSFVALSEHGVIVSNMGNGTCAIKDYVLGGAREVKDVNGCDYLYTAGVKPFSIIGIADDRLSFGNYYSSEDIGTTAEKRPDSFAVGEELEKTATPIFDMSDSPSSMIGFNCSGSHTMGGCASKTSQSVSFQDAVVDEPFGKWAIDSTSEIHGDMIINADGTGEERILQGNSVIQSSKFKVTVDLTTTPKRMLHVFNISDRKVYCLFERFASNLMKLNCSGTSYPASLAGSSTWHTY